MQTPIDEMTTEDRVAIDRLRHISDKISRDVDSLTDDELEWITDLSFEVDPEGTKLDFYNALRSRQAYESGIRVLPDGEITITFRAFVEALRSVRNDHENHG